MIPPDWKCPRRVGFLFPRPCLNTSPIGCRDCENGQIEDPYRSRHQQYDYTDYDYYSDASYDSFAGGDDAADDFTEADGETLVKQDEVFEDDMSAS